MQFPQAQQLQTEVDALTAQMSDPAVQKNSAKVKELSRQHREKQALLGLVEAFEKVYQELEEVALLVSSEEPEIRQLAEADRERLTQQKAKLEHQIEEALLPKD